MRAVDLINKKREGLPMTDDEIRFLVSGFVDGSVPDYQMSAWMMAVCLRGMTHHEIAALTNAMACSGAMVDLSALSGIKVDKHSTGGVGDTTTLVSAPIAAACGVTVAKMSGRGLGHTGGTLDKLEAIPGVNIERSVDEMIEIVKKTGLCVIGQSSGLDPADKLMYALRDVTGTVKSIPLIASSIMSKKIAAGADAIVLDVKTGSGAFMETLERARELAATMVNIGEKLGRRTVALITDMNCPLGRAVGNGLEVADAVYVLRGEVKRGDPLRDVCVLISAYMLMLGGAAKNIGEAKNAAERAIASGAALNKLREMVEALGGDGSFIDEPEKLTRVKRIYELKSRAAGHVRSINALDIGVASAMLGAGRAKKSDKIDPAVGIVLKKRVGEYVGANEPLALMYVNDDTSLEESSALALKAFEIGEKPTFVPPMVYETVTAENAACDLESACAPIL